MALGGCLWLGACTPFAGAVSDASPSLAGGRAKDVPPRPGAPVSKSSWPAGRTRTWPRQMRRRRLRRLRHRCGCAGGRRPGTTYARACSPPAPGPTAAAPPPAASYPQPPPQAPLPPAYARPDDRSATQGGLASTTLAGLLTLLFLADPGSAVRTLPTSGTTTVASVSGGRLLPLETLPLYPLGPGRSVLAHSWRQAPPARKLNRRRLPQQLRQLGEVHRHLPRLVPVGRLAARRSDIFLKSGEKRKCAACA